MNIKHFLAESLFLIIYSVFPLFIVYTNFIFLRIFVVRPNTFNVSTVIIFLIIMKILLTFVILYFVLITDTDNKSTQDIFPLSSKHEYSKKIEHLNPFINYLLSDQSIVKTITCTKCKTYKPPRCHHCSRCNRCYLKYDHHCIFLDTCIGFHNYKFFLLFLVGSILYISFYMTITLIEFFKSANDLSSSLIVNFIVSSSLSCIVIIIIIQTLIFQIKLLPNNETFVEYLAINDYLQGDHTHINVFQEGPIREFSDSKDRKILNPYNLGFVQNFKEVFGNKIYEWFLPSFTSIGDGITFKTNYDSQ